MSDVSEGGSLQAEIRRLAGAFRTGHFGERGKTDGLETRDREAIAGVNGIIDSIVAPLRLAA
ncbi:MAG: hypothetical protein ABSF23_17220, partial [Terracidiphilus sp.]